LKVTEMRIQKASAQRGITGLVAAGALAVGMLALAPLGQARSAAGNALEVTFTAGGVITMTLPDGTPVGTTTGAPTVIPAGSYVVYLQGPDGCVDLPFDMLKGPGENIVDNLSSGASTTATTPTSRRAPPTGGSTTRTRRSSSASRRPVPAAAAPCSSS
jgi:hypothetical protein